MEEEKSYRVEDQIGFKLRLANQKHLEVFSAMMPEVTPTQFAVLAKLLERGSLSQNRLGRLVHLDAATIKGVVDRLLRKEFVDRTRSATDLRRLNVSLTAKGRSFCNDATKTASQISDRTAAKLTPRELDRLIALLDKL